MKDQLECVFFSSRRRHTRYWRDWSSDVCSSDLATGVDVKEGLPVGVVEAGLGGRNDKPEENAGLMTSKDAGDEKKLSNKLDSDSDDKNEQNLGEKDTESSGADKEKKTQIINVNSNINNAADLRLSDETYMHFADEPSINFTRDESQKTVLVVVRPYNDYEFIRWTEDEKEISREFLIEIPFEENRTRNLVAELKKIEERTEYIVIDASSGKFSLPMAQFSEEGVPRLDTIGFGLMLDDNFERGDQIDEDNIIFGSRNSKKPLFRSNVLQYINGKKFTDFDSMMDMVVEPGVGEGDNITYDISDALRKGRPDVAPFITKYKGIKMIFGNKKPDTHKPDGTKPSNPEKPMTPPGAKDDDSVTDKPRVDRPEKPKELIEQIGRAHV